ncbi:hypothetical protein DFAR_1830015 [Desulfarculales bacterium]
MNIFLGCKVLGLVLAPLVVALAPAAGLLTCPWRLPWLWPARHSWGSCCPAWCRIT